jgi:tape measure domain-containing protein
MATTDDLTLRIKAQGARQSSRDVDRTSGSVRQLGRQTNVAAKGVRSLSREAGRASVSLRTLATGAAAYKIAGAIGGAVSQGFAYNKMIDSQNVAFTTLLGSQKRSAVFMAQIQALALKSPVLDPESTGDSARLLMAYGISAKRTLPFVEALGNMAATTGRSIQESMPRGAMALGQIGSKGRLQSEELNQLAESVGLSRDRIRKALDMTREDFNATLAPGGTNIPASKALPAILEAMRKQSGGAADRLSKTSQGKMDRLREVWKKAMGGLTEDLYDARGNIAGALATIIQDKDLNFGEKVAAARKAVQRELRPLAQQFTG